MNGLPFKLTLKSDQDTIETLETTLDADGRYSVNTPTLGEWEIVAKSNRWLSKKSDSAEIRGNVTLNFSLPRNGDVNNDNVIDDFDLADVIFDFGNPPSGNHGLTDLTGNGVVDDFDLAAVIFNFGYQGEE